MKNWLCADDNSDESIPSLSTQSHFTQSTPSDYYPAMADASDCLEDGLRSSAIVEKEIEPEIEPDENPWVEITYERRRIKNRIAQRNYRKLSFLEGAIFGLS